MAQFLGAGLDQFQTGGVSSLVEPLPPPRRKGALGARSSVAGWNTRRFSSVSRFERLRPEGPRLRRGIGYFEDAPIGGDLGPMDGGAVDDRSGSARYDLLTYSAVAVLYGSTSPSRERPGQTMRRTLIVAASLCLIAVSVGAQGPSTAPTASGDAFTLEWSSLDTNHFPLNPFWRGQRGTKLPLDSDALCGGFPDGKPYGDPRCTTDTVSIDKPGRFHGFFCDFGGGKFNGHINWRPVTFEGRTFWNDHQVEIFGDDDYTFEMFRPDASAQTVRNKGSLHLEANGDETFDRFTAGWWKEFGTASDADRSSSVQGLFTVASGMLNVDVVHGGHAEVHPLYAMAMRVSHATTPTGGEYRERWAIFARNWGNEGYCSRDQHYLTNLPGDAIAIKLPLGPLADVRVVWADTKFRGNHPDIRGPHVTRVSDGVVVRFTLPDARKHPRVHGDLVLDWRPKPSTQPTAYGAAPSRTAVQRRREPRTELEEVLERRLSDSDRRRLAPPGYGAGADEREVARDAAFDRVPPESALAGEGPQVVSLENPERRAREDREAEAMCSVVQGVTPGDLEGMSTRLGDQIRALRSECEKNGLLQRRQE